MENSEYIKSEFFDKTLDATFKVILITSCGMTLAKRKTIQPSCSMTIYQMAENLYLPCLFFACFLSSFNLFDLQSWLPCVLISIVFVLFETGIGCIIYKKIIQDHEFGNKLSEIWISNKIDILPLALISLLADGLNSLYKESEISASSRTTSYLLIYSLVSSILRKVIANKLNERLNPSGHRESYTKDLELRDPLDGKVNEETQNAEKSAFLSTFLDLNLIIAIVAVMLTLFTPIKDIFLSSNSLVQKTLTESTIKCGYAAPSLLLIHLGSVLFQLKNSPQSSKKKIFVILAATKCLLLPFFGIILFELLKTFSLIQDPLLIFQMLICASAPMSLTTLVTDLVNKKESEFTEFAFWQHVFTLISTVTVSFIFVRSHI